jgi:hypothetical protein
MQVSMKVKDAGIKEYVNVEAKDKKSQSWDGGGG